MSAGTRSKKRGTTLRVWPRVPLLMVGILTLFAAIWGGVTRLPVSLPLPADNANWLSFHGPLMVCGFLGTVIALERAVGLPGRWPYLAPVLTGAGALALLAGAAGRTGACWLTTGSAFFLVVTWRVVQLRRELFTATMSLGAVSWLIGNALWLADWPIERVVPWWIVFLALTIAGERLDLSRFQKVVPAAQPLFLTVLVGLFSALLVGLISPDWGGRLLGVMLIALAGWHARFDFARRTFRQPGLPGFMSACLLSGFAWMAVSGVVLAGWTPLRPGTTYDAALHAFFLGFVFSMIFAHAPVIFPSILGRPVAFHRRFYVHVALLHLSLIGRVSAAVIGSPELRQWSAVANGLALVLFLASTVTAMAFGKRGE